MEQKKVVLAFSGGLDTSVCIPLLREHYGFDEIVTVAAVSYTHLTLPTSDLV